MAAAVEGEVALAAVWASYGASSWLSDCSVGLVGFVADMESLCWMAKGKGIEVSSKYRPLGKVSRVHIRLQSALTW